MRNIAVGFLVFLVALPVFAHQITEAQRKEKITFNLKMAERYTVMAECLKAGKPLDDCNTEAMKGCPFMEKGHLDKEMMREHMKKIKK